MSTFAAIDIGSNSCRLKIARVVAHRLKTLHEDREVTRLGSSVFDTGLISPDAMADTLRALKRFQRSVQSFGVDRIRVVATAATRDARNAQAFVTWAKAETGWNLEVISGLEEGRLIHRGVMSNEPGTDGKVMLVDVGGGSCEITLSENKRIKETVSLPLGAVRLTQEFLPADPATAPPADGIERMKRFISRELRRARSVLQPGSVPLVIATSGTAAALSDARRMLVKGAEKPAAESDAKAQDNLPVGKAKTAPAPDITTARDVRRMAERLRKLNYEQRAAIAGIGARRAEIIVAGAFVYAELLESFELPGFRYADLGLRDGILAIMLAEQDGRASDHQEFAHERWESVLSTAARFGVDLRQAEPVRAHAVQLFHGLRSLHKLPAEYESWLAAAAILRDTGKFLNHQGHHRHTQYIISSSEIYGYTQQQRTIISAIARYLGKTRPQPDDRPMRNIAPEEHQHVKSAVVLLRLAVALNQDRASDVVRVTPRVYPKRVLMELEPGKTGAELELWSLRKEADYFREVFGRELFVTLV